MTRVRDRVFAWFGVVIAVISVVALSVAVIIQQVMTDRSAASQTAVQSQAASLNSCTDTQTHAALPVPQAYTTDQPVTTLQSTDLTIGSGLPAKAGDCLVVKYYGTLAKDGTLFDESYTKTSAFAFTLGKGQVIAGWDQGVVGMKVGAQRRLVIPAALGYGSRGAGSIPANSDLVFYVTLLQIK
jgi:FKBP-type peptidyl-prolyl cis-trans isomerase